ncbi:MAG: hypothetical protein QM758_23980 [Armatimonas sp.]
MNINKISKIFAVCALVGIAGNAFADTKDVEKPFRISVGAFMPSKAALKNVSGKTWTSFGVSYDLGKTKSDKPWIYSVYGDFTGKKGQLENGSRVSNDMYGIGVSGRYMFSSPDAPSTAYAGVGVGAYRLKSGSSTQNKVGFKVSGGYEWKNGLFGEVSAVQPGIKNANGVEARIGFRF